MRYDLPSFRIDRADWLKGNNAYDTFPDKGLLSSSVGANVFSKPGYLTGNPAPTVLADTYGISGFIGYCVPKAAGNSTSTLSFVSVLTTNASADPIVQTFSVPGYTTSGGTSVTSNAVDVVAGRSDIISYSGNTYVTTDGNVAKMSNALAGPDWTYWTGTAAKGALKTGVPHPMAEYESILYIADGKYLHKIDGTTASEQVFDLPPGFVITAMVEYQAMLYIAGEHYVNGSTGTTHSGSYLFTWDGLMESWHEQYFVDYRVDAMYVFKDQLFMWTPYFVGRWNGAEIVPLRPVASRVFKHQIASSANSMFWAEGADLMRYGAPHMESIPRQCYRFTTFAGLPLAGILSVRANELVVSQTHGTAGPAYSYSDVNAASASGDTVHKFNPRLIEAPVNVRGIVVETEPLTTGQKVKVEYVNDQGTTVTPEEGGLFDNAVSGMAGKTYHRFDVFNTVPSRTIEPRVTTTAGVHVKFVDYIYQASESRQSIS